MKNKSFALFLALGVIIVVVAGVILKQTLFPKKLEIETLYPGDTAMWENIFNQGEYSFESKPNGVILPHHMVVAYELSKFYRGLSKVANPSVVVVIGPNHYENGEANIQTCLSCVYKTTAGDLKVNKDMISKMIDAGVAVRMDETFANEHSIFSHSAFIKKFLPNSEIVPIVLQWEIDIEDVTKLVDFLNENLPPDALVVGSVDFSHDQRKSVADFHDQSSFSTISNFDLNNVYDLEVDSPSSIYAVLDLMQRQDYTKVKRFAHTNNDDYSEEPVELGTSHQFIGFFEGESGMRKGVSILSFGNIPENDLLGLVDDWNWDRDYDETADMSISKNLRDIRGKEDRFLSGSDFLAFDLNDGGCELNEQNGLKIDFCKFSQGKDYEDDPLDIIKTADEEADVVYLLYEFEGTELNDDQKKLARDFVSKGVDIFVGRGFKYVIPFEKYKNALIFYSLGNFIIDNSLVTELESKSTGAAMGLYIMENSVEIYFFPVFVTNGYPKLKSFSESKMDFVKFISASGLSKDADLDNGVLKIEF